jgi:esterase/lipase superfamily enzyme
MNDQDGLRMSSAQYILILVHGFNNSRSDAETSYGIFTDHILPGLQRSRVGPDAIAQFHWPGDESVGLLPRAAGYATDVSRAFTAAKRLAEFLAQLAALRSDTAPLRVTFVGHSLGCRLILEALNQLSSGAPTIEVIGLMAAAAPVNLTRRDAALYQTGRAPRQVLKFCSEQDQVLHLAFPLGQFAAFTSGIETANYTEAIGRFGHPNEFGVRSPRPNNGHSDYWKDTVVVDIMLGQIDAKERQLPAPAELMDRRMATAAGPADRALPTRSASLG